MLGTLNGALEARGIQLEPDAIVADAEGHLELVDGMITLTRIHVQYRLRIPAGSRDKVDRALSRHRDRCPTAHSLKGAIDVEWSAEIDEVPAD
ncbi:MAG TPA: OsmC family protein [Longimicrobiales bacterium]|nr:OsmC family protein [Longimicrobiales bacterium]